MGALGLCNLLSAHEAHSTTVFNWAYLREWVQNY